MGERREMGEVVGERGGWRKRGMEEEGGVVTVRGTADVGRKFGCTPRLRWSMAALRLITEESC